MRKKCTSKTTAKYQTKINKNTNNSNALKVSDKLVGVPIHKGISRQNLPK